jgi:outer membrane protein assembly factor BamB
VKDNLVYRLVLTALSVSLLSISVCKKPEVGEPPKIPAAPTGTTPGGRNAGYDFFATTTDPDTDSICLRFQWGDGATSDWSYWVASGETVTMSHAWADSGTYPVKAQAKDMPGNITDWSAPFAVKILSTQAPNTPAVPTGPPIARKDTLYTFTTIASDPDGDGVSYRFAWGNGDTSDWTDWVASGQPGSATYAFLRSGTYQVHAQARDVHEAPSAWSISRTVVVVNPYPASKPPAPTGVRITPPDESVAVFCTASDSGGDSVSVRFSWGNGDTSEWSPFEPSGTDFQRNFASHEQGGFLVNVQARDEESLVSNWSAPETITVTYLKWRYDCRVSFVASPALADDGTIYIGSMDSSLYAVNPDGTVKWRCPTDGRLLSSPAVRPDGAVYVGSEDSALYAITPQGARLWRYGAADKVYSTPAVASDGTVYFGSLDGYLYALGSSGLFFWRYQTGGGINCSPAIASDGTIYVGATNAWVFAINPDGSLKWRYQTGGPIWSSAAIGADGTVYIGTSDSCLYAIKANGTLDWRYKTGGRADYAAAIGADGTVYFGSNDNCYYALNSDGTLKWRYQVFGIISSSPAIAADGTIYCTTGNDIDALNPDGTLKWHYTTGSTIQSPPTVAPDGTIYIGSNDGYLHAFFGDSPLANSAWPKFHHDAKNTGRVGGWR